jgi:hypothetical protein
MLNTYCLSFLLGIALLLAAAIPGVACYSGLLVIPTADALGADQYDIELQVDGAAEKLKADTYLLNTQFGIGDRLELGVDVDLAEEADERLLFNGKYILGTSADGLLAVAVGICNCTTSADLEESPYLVATRDCTTYRGTLGLMYLNGKTEAVVGVDKALDDQMMLAADYTTGDENTSSAAFSYTCSDRTSLMAGVMLPNNGSLADARYSVHLCFTGAYRHTGETD